jgi:hypothetical protein
MFYPGYTLRARASIPPYVLEEHSTRPVHTSSDSTDGEVQGNTLALTIDICEVPKIVITDFDEVLSHPHHEDDIDQIHCGAVAHTSHLAPPGPQAIAAADHVRGHLQVPRGHDHDQNIEHEHLVPRGALQLEHVVLVPERLVVTIHFWHIVLMLLRLWALWVCLTSRS